MLILKCFCRSLVVVLLVYFGNKVYAEQPSLNDYCNLVHSGKFIIEASISHNNTINSKQDSLRQYVKLVEKGEKRYFRVYKENIGTQKRDYFLIRRYNSPNEEKYSYKYSDKPITNFDIGWGKKAIERWFGTGYVQETIKNEVQNSNDELLSMLGPISQVNRKLARYKVRFQNSGKWSKNGVTYDYDQYELVEPATGILVMCYDKGVLKLCIKSQRKHITENEWFGTFQLHETKAVVVEFREFSQLVDDKYFSFNSK